MMRQENKIEFTVQLDESDIYAFQSQLLWRRSKIVFFIFGISYLLLILTLVLSYVATDTWHIVTTFIALTLPFFMWHLRKRVARKTFQSHASLQEEQDYTIEKEKVTIKGESFEISFELKNLKRISYTKKVILLWQTNTTANIIPVRSLTEEQLRLMKKITLPYKKTKR